MAIPSPIEREDTAKLSIRMMSEVASVGQAGQVAPYNDAGERFIDAVAEKFYEKVGGGDGGPPKKTFLGVDVGGWVKYVIAAVIAVGAWYLTIRDGIKDRPTFSVMEARMESVLVKHTGDQHPKTLIQIDEIRKAQQDIRESQIRQEMVSKQQAETLQEIKEQLRRIR